MRLLIVEDDRQLAERLQQQLARDGLVADLAHDGIDGQHLGDVEEYDLVVLDLGLPGRSGLHPVSRHTRLAAYTTRRL